MKASVTISANPPVRLRQLDAIRGIAALIVVFNHYIQVIPEDVRQLVSIQEGWKNIIAWQTPWPWLRFTPLRIIVNGHAAVDIFFVLSGFVLALPLLSQRQPAYWPFLIKRLCRVYIPFLVVICIVYLSLIYIQPKANLSLSRWLNGQIPSLNKISLIDHLLMTGKDMKLNPVMWTLVHEIRVSVILPLVFLSIRYFGTLRTVISSVIISFISSFGLDDSISGTWQATMHYLWMFASGSAMSFNRDYLSEVIKKASSNHMVLLWILTLGLLITPFDRVWSDFMMGTGSCLLIILCLPKSKVTHFLTSPIPVWLGRISYSLYLIHLPILIMAITTSDLTLLEIFIITLIAAELAFRSIEAPSHQLGILLNRKF